MPSASLNSEVSGNERIVSVRGIEILDSRGNPTVEAEVVLAGGVKARAAAPSGASVGSREAVELRDGDNRYNGKGVKNAVAGVGKIADALCGQDVGRQDLIDDTLIRLDGTPDKSRLGANALLAVSLACAKAAAKNAGKSLYQNLSKTNLATLPTPMLNILNGGAHAANNINIQEFMIMPTGFADFPSALRAGVEVFFTLKSILTERGLSTAVGDEGGFAPNLPDSESALSLLCLAIEKSDYRPGDEIGIALDCAASEFYNGEQYQLNGENFSGDAAAFVKLLDDWTSKYPIVSIEDGCAENDWDGWKHLTQTLGARTQLVGDDLFVTNPALLQNGIRLGVATALLAKPNQIGTLTETIKTVRLAEQAGYGVVLSHRSGETENTEIADLAVALNTGQIKTGAPCRGERTAKYNRLLRIAQELGDSAKYAGKQALTLRPATS